MSRQKGDGFRSGLRDFQDSIAPVILDETSQSCRDKNEGLCHVENTQSKETSNEICTVDECVILKEKQHKYIKNYR